MALLITLAISTEESWRCGETSVDLVLPNEKTGYGDGLQVQVHQTR
jgi:hypothetical protein